MADYSINIYDNNNLEASTVLEFAERDSLRLRWNGGDKIKTIIGSDLFFKMEVTNFQDGYFSHLYTNDERRYNVTIQDEGNNAIVWAGHILPDQYREPFVNGAFFVEFVATDGLGALKDQELPEAFYSGEHTLAAILAEALKLTGLELELIVSPAITNIKNTRLDQLYINAGIFDGDERDDAYKIITTILEASLCCIFQEGGAWRIYGHNKRNVLQLDYQVYDTAGIYIGDQSLAKAIKQRTFLYEPAVEVVTPRKTVRAFYDLTPKVINPDVYKVKNKGYTLLNIPALTVSPDWIYTSVGYTAKYDPKDGQVFLDVVGQDLTEYIELRQELLLLAGTKIEWSINLKSRYSGTEAFLETIEEMITAGRWQKIVLYDIYYTDPVTGSEVLQFSNINGPDADDLKYQLNFNVDRNAELIIQAIAPATAFYNIRFYDPGSTGAVIKTDRIDIVALELITINAQDRKEYTSEIPGVYTLNQEIELGIHDDAEDLDRMIRLLPLITTGAAYDIRIFNNIQVIDVNDDHFIKFTFPNLELAAANLTTITVNDEPLLEAVPIYNYLGADEMVLQYDPAIFGRTIANGEYLKIELRRYADLPNDVATWTQWSDDVYNVTYKRYAEAAADILRNLFTAAHPRIFANCEGFITPRDLLNFNYNGSKTFYVLDCEVLLDKGESSLIMCQNFYGQAISTNLPPVVDAGPDLALPENDNIIALTATASDPDGNIVTVLWELVSGSGGSVVIATPSDLSTQVSGLTGDQYTFRVTVTDDAGLKASDTVIISRVLNYVIFLDYVQEYQSDDLQEAVDRKLFYLRISPAMDPNHTVRFTIRLVTNRETPNDIAGLKPSVIFTVANPFPIYQAFNEVNTTFEFLARAGDDIYINMQAKAFNTLGPFGQPEFIDTVFAEIEADFSAEFITGPAGIIGNNPVSLRVDARK